MLQFSFDQRLFTRRRWLGVSALAGVRAAVATNSVSGAEAALKRQAGFGRAKSVIVVFASGGQSQIDMFDPKPDAPQDVRGDFRAIATAIPGVQFGEHLPQLARVADRCTVLRSMSHEDRDHGSAVYLTLTGHYHAQRSGNPPIRPTDAPTFGAIYRRLRPQSRFVVDALHVNGPAIVPREPSPGQDAGFLGRAFEPLVIGDPSTSAGAIPGLETQTGLEPVRFGSRLSLKESLDHCVRELETNRQSLDLNRLYHQAFDVLASPRARQAFDLEQEPAAVRDRYGRHRSGQSCLLARRLVEAGVPYVNVIWNHCNRGQDVDADDTDLYGWDTHNDIFDSLRDRLLPRFDQSFSALIEDLDQRGLLAETLVVCLGEFGRAPQVAVESKFAGALPGRKHWPNVYSIVLAGAGVQRGAVVGASDRIGGEPITDRFGPWDVAATIFHALGIDPSGHFTDLQNRTFQICSGDVIRPIY